MEKFDVFLAHNSQDKPIVRAIAQHLKQKGLNPWLDQEQIVAGDNIQKVVFQGISQSKVGAFFISQNGLGTFQEHLELGAIIQFFLQQNKAEGFRVIPVLLPGINDIPKELFYLNQWAWIKFKSSNDEDALEDLIRGIRGRVTETKPPQVIPNFLKKLIRDIRGRSAETKLPQVIPIPDITPKIKSQLTTNPKQTQEPEKISPSTQDNGNQSQDRRQFLKWVGWGTVSLVTPVLGRVIWLTQNPSLESENSRDYTKLRRLLANKNWKEADNETYRVMIQAVSKKEGDLFTSDEILNFPCTDLRTIDQLWAKYSNGHFGFSVQKEIYLSVGGKADGKYYKEAWEKFGDRVGWRVKSRWILYTDVTFDTSSPVGHLPLFTFAFLSGGGTTEMGVGGFSSLASRLINCNTP